MSDETVSSTAHIRSTFGGALLGDGGEVDPEEVRKENLAEFDRWFAAERGKAYARAASWARCCSGGSADAAADYIEELAEFEAKVAAA